MFVSDRRERSVDVMRADTVDLELDRLISRRASTDHRTSADELEPGYVESVRRFNARVRAENRAAWSEFHRGQAQRHRAVLEALIARHEAEAEKLMKTDEQRRTA
jgi:uncharacterized protein with PIN domain